MAADVEGVQRLLEELHRHCRESFPDSEINDPATLVEQLSIAVLAVDPRSPGHEADVSLFASFMFESQAPRDLLSFVTDTINTSAKVTKKSRTAALKAVGDFAKHLKGTSVIDRHARRIKDGVWAVFSKERESQEVRAHALRPLRELLKVKPSSLVAETWDVPLMWETIKEQYRLGSSKISQSCKGELLKLAGSLLLVYGRDVPELAEEVQTILGWCDVALDDNAKNQQLGKSLQPQIVAGALACLDLACSAGFEERYTFKPGESHSKPNTKLYMHLLRAVREGSDEDLKRFEVSAKALRFFRRHAGLFADSIGPLARVRQLYDLMEKCATTGGRNSRLKLKKHALPAIEAILREVARYTAGRPQNKATLDELEETFLKHLEGVRPTAEQTTVALAGLAALSPAATALSSAEQAADVADRLLICLDSALGRLDAVGFTGDGSDEETEEEDGVKGTREGDGEAAFKRNLSLRLEAQFLRTLACRAGVLGGVSTRERVSPSSAKVAGERSPRMDLDKGKGRAVSGAMGGAVPGHLLRRLQTLSLRLVEKYALLSPKDRGLACQGLCQLWLAFAGPGQGDNLSQMLGIVVQKGVSLAGTMETPGGGIDESGEPSAAPVRWVAPVDPATGAVDARLCFLYADLWRRVVSPGVMELEPLQAWEWACREAPGRAVSVVYRDLVAPELYDAVVGAVVTAVKRLDLRYSYGEERGSTPIPLHPTDQNIFLNIVSFCQDLLPTCRPDLLLEWVPILCSELVKRSLERPLVSGFYRLITLIFRETARVGYFDDRPQPSSNTSEEVVLFPPSPGSVAAAIGLGQSNLAGEGDNRCLLADSKNSGADRDHREEGGIGDVERSGCRRVFCRYLEWVTVRLGGFRDELLAACTETLLSAPVGLLGGDLGPLLPALKAALTSGASHLPTAVIAVEALERWREEMLELLEPHLGEILPHLDKHLSARGLESGSTEKARASKSGKAASFSTRKAVAWGAGNDVAGEDMRRKDLRRRIVRLLGRLGGRNHLVATDASKALSNSLAWDTEPRILLGVPFKDRQKPVTICLDGVLQRLVELARHDGTRQTKSLAAECLHALVVYMVGCTATDPSSGQQGKPGEFSKLFRRVFPAVLRLAVDLDETTRILFSKLSMQLVRWFSQAQTDNEDTLALLDCLGEGAAAEEGGPLREVCAKGVVEFLRYAIKQSSKKQQAAGPVAVDALLTRVFSLATHPDKNRRLGGLMAFNQLCRPLREETSLLDRYALRLLHVALISLRRAHHDHSALEVIDAASSAVDRALRIVHDSVADMGDRADLLKRKETRGELCSVEEMVSWAWDKVGAVETRFRRKCMTVLLALCPLVVEMTDDLDSLPSDNDGARTWVWRNLKNSGRSGISEAVRVFESSAFQGQTSSATGGGDSGSGTLGSSNTPGSDQPRGLGDPGAEAHDCDQREWDQIATSADCYNFARETKIITAAELFIGSASANGGNSSGSTGTCLALGGKRKTSSSASSASGRAAEGDEGSSSSQTEAPSPTKPRVLRLLARAIKRFGTFLEGYPIQSLVSDGDAAGGVEGINASPDGRRAGNNNDRRLEVDASRPFIVDGPGLLPTERAAQQLSRAVLLRRGFTLLAGCLSDSNSGVQKDEMAALLVKEGLWNRHTHLVVIYSLLWPWAGGLLPRGSDGDEVEQFLPAAVERLLKHWEALDKAAGPGSGFLDTLRSQLRVWVCEQYSVGVNTSGHSGDRDGDGDGVAVSLCQWVLSQSLSSQRAFSRPSLRTGGPLSSASPGDVGAHLPQTFKGSRSPTSVTDDELIGRIIRGYRSFANAGLFGNVAVSGSGGDGDALHLATKLWSTVLNLPEGLRPASESRAKSALRLAIDLGLPTTTEMITSSTSDVARTSRSSSVGSILDSVLNVRPAERVGTGGMGATRGALFYRRFPELVHEVFLRRGPNCPWPSVCRSLVDACLDRGEMEMNRCPSVRAVQAFSVLEGVVLYVSEKQQLGGNTLSSRGVVMDSREVLSVVMPQFRRLVDDASWGPPPPAAQEGAGGNIAVVGKGIMLRELLRLCHRLLRMSVTADLQSLPMLQTTHDSSKPSSCLRPLLELSVRLVAGTLGSASAAVRAPAKADALTLVPFFRPCLTTRARDYGKAAAASQVENGGQDTGGIIVLSAVEEMMSRHFPIEDSREPAEGSDQATAFALLLKGLLGAFVRCGDLGLLKLLFGTLAEGRKHLHYRWISRAMDAFVSRLDVEAGGIAEAVFGFCLDNLASKRVGASIKATLFDKVCLPMLRRCPVEVSKPLYVCTTVGGSFRPVSAGNTAAGSVLERLLAVVKRRSKAGAFLDGPLVASCCFSLVEALYDMFDLQPLQALASEAFHESEQASSGKGGEEPKGLALKGVTLGIISAWKATCASDNMFDGDWRELRCRRAAFSCICMVVSSTQEQEKFFDKLLWLDPLYEKPSAQVTAAVAGKSSVLALVLDMKKEHQFEVSPPPFQSIMLRLARPPLLGCARNTDKTAGKKRHRGMTASSMLSQSSLGFGGDSLAGDGWEICGNGGDGLNTVTEDARETYSSQAALTEPRVVLGGNDESETKSEHSRSQSQSQSQGDMVPVFGRGAGTAIENYDGSGMASEEDGSEKKREDIVLEMSHMNKEPCMRSLLLVVEKEHRLFGEAWIDKTKQSNGVFEPAWSAKMRAKLKDIDLPRNIRLMIFQFALNNPVSSILLPWAVPWIKSMADFALSPLPEGLRTDGEQGLHYLLRDFTQLLLDESSGSGWGGVVREARAAERRKAEEAGNPGDISRQPLLDVGNRLVSHLMSVSSCPEGKTAVLRANVLLVAGMVGIFGDVVIQHTTDSGAEVEVEGHHTGRRNDLRLNLEFIVDMLREKEGYTGGAHASTQSTGVQAKHTILTGLNLLGVLMGKRVSVFGASVRAANELARTLPEVCLSYTQKNAFETGTELLAMALAHVSWLKHEGGLPADDNLCSVLCQAEGSEWLVHRVTDRLMRMGRDAKLRSRFVHAVAAIAGVYPSVLTRQLLLTCLGAMQFADPTCRGRFLATLADALPKGQVPNLEVQDLFTRLQPHLPSLLLEPEVEFIRGSKDNGTASEWRPTAQLSALRLVRELTKKMTSKQLGVLLGEDDAHSLVGLATPSTYRGCREIVYATLLDLHVAARESPDPADSDRTSTAAAHDNPLRGGAALTLAQRETVRCALLRGLSDPDDEGMTFDDKAPVGVGAEQAEGTTGDTSKRQASQRHGIRRSLLEVFDAPPAVQTGGGGLDEEPGQRLLSLMRDMFDARTAHAWLRFAPYLLLRPAEQAPGYHDVLFKKSLLSCEFVDMSVTAGGNGGIDARPMEPVFSYASLSSQQQQNEANYASFGAGAGRAGVSSYGTLSTDVDVRQAGLVRATQDYLWSRTQGGDRGGKKSDEQAAGARANYVSFPSQTQSRMLGGPRTYAGSQTVMPPPAPRAPKISGDSRSRGGGVVASQGGGIGKRFRRTSGGSVSSVAKGETFGMQRRMAAKRERDKATRAKRAVIYRKYRDGELPDIMIKLGDVLRPLQHLCMLDGGIAREVFVEVFKEVYASLDGSARDPSISASGGNAWTKCEADEEIDTETLAGGGRRAVSVLLQKMLSAARHDTGVVACLHAACRATSTVAIDPTDGGGNTDLAKPPSSALSRQYQEKRSGRLVEVPPSSAPGSAVRSQASRGPVAMGAASEVMTRGGDAISLSPHLVANTALSSLNIHSGILLLEDSIMRSGKQRVAAETFAGASGVAHAGAGGAGGSGGKRSRRRSGGAAGGVDEQKHRAVVNLEGQQESWLQLSKLYAALGERDALVGVAARASKLEGTRQALEAELSGEYDFARRVYKKLLDRYDTRYEKDGESQSRSLRVEEEDEQEEGEAVATVAELRAWDMHQLECMRQLGQWQELRGEVVDMVSENEDNDVDGQRYGLEERISVECQRRLWEAEPTQRDDVLPFFVWSIVHDQRRGEFAINALLDAIVDPEAPALRLTESWRDSQEGAAGEATSSSGKGSRGGGAAGGVSSSSTCTRLEWLETNMPGELAKAFLLGGQLGRAHQSVARCFDKFQEKWAGLHPCADSARRDQLRGLQLVVEIEDFLSFHDQKVSSRSSQRSTPGLSPTASAGGLPGRLTELLSKWSCQAPSKSLDPLTSWSVVVAHRQDCFRAIEVDFKESELSKKRVTACQRDMLKHMGDLSLAAAGAAIVQGVQKVAERLILSYTSIKKQASRLFSTEDYQQQELPQAQGEVLTSQAVAAGGEENWDLQLTLTTVQYNRAKLERLRFSGSRGADVAHKRADTVARTLKMLDGCIVQQREAMGAHASSSHSGSSWRRDCIGGSSQGWGEGDGWDSHGSKAHETRLRLLTLQGEWLERKARMLAESNSAGVGKGREVAHNLQEALTSLEQATHHWDRLVVTLDPVRRSGVSTPPSSSVKTGSVGVGASGIIEAAGESMLRLAKLCEVLSTGDAGLDAGSAGGGRGREELAALAVKEYLRAMAIGSPGARDRFPRVLFLAGRFPRARDAFADGAPAVAEWAFLRWISQMLSVTGREEGPVVIQVLERVALAYPRALFYPLLMTKSSAFATRGESSGANDMQRLSKLSALTFDASGEAFVEALGGLHHPEMRFTDAMKRVLGLLAANKIDLARETYRKMRKDCLVTTGRKTGDDKVGMYNREFAKRRVKDLDKTMGKDGEKLDIKKAKKFIAEGRRWTAGAVRPSRVKLSSFSTWMSGFDSNLHKLEVPGQYGGITEAPPRVSHHSLIVSFDNELLMMNSMRLPKRLIIHGDDEKDHMFLVKGGEDLRVDERVEQLFEVMNAVMAKSASCKRSRLCNRTYKVIPMTPDIGLIEWVQNTRPLKSVIEGGLGSVLGRLEAVKIFGRFVRTGSPKDYHDVFKQKRRPEVENMFARCCETVPADALRRHLLAMAPSPEAFLTCRGGFARSLATLNACSYVLGIGDRHLDNFLLDTTTGTVVSIDFGASFGIGHTELPVPEMIPFRLTNQFKNILQPLDSVGLLTGHMVSTLQALRGGSEVLLATMDVFLNEPVINWITEDTGRRQQKTARSCGVGQESDEDEELGNPGTRGGGSQPRPPWEARRKIKNTRRKLLGENPAAILIDDLAQNGFVKQMGSLEKLKAIAWGSSGDRVRSRPEHREGWLSVEDQVECLIDLATDADVLGRQYSGLATWV